MKSKRVLSLILVALILFSFIPFQVTEAAYDGYFLQVLVNKKDNTVVGNVVYDKTGGAVGTALEGAWTGLKNFGKSIFGGEKEEVVFDDAKTHLEYAAKNFNSNVESAENWEFTFPPREKTIGDISEDGKGKAWLNGTGADAQRAIEMSNQLVKSVNDLAYALNDGKEFASTDDFVAMLDKIAGISGSTTINGKSVSIVDNPDPKKDSNDRRKYVKLGDEYFLWSMRRGYNTELLEDGTKSPTFIAEGYYGGDEEKNDTMTIADIAKYAAGFYGMLIYVDSANAIQKPGKLEGFIVEFVSSALISIQSALGLQSVNDVVFNQGERATYVNGVMRQGWFVKTQGFFVIFTAIALSLVGFILAKAVFEKNMSTLSTNRRLSLMERIKDLVIVMFILAFSYPVIKVLFFLNESLVNMFRVTTPGNGLLNLGGQTGSYGTIGGLAITIAMFIVCLRLNFEFVIRSVTICFLVATAPLFIISIPFTGNRKIFTSWFRELLGNIFTQSFYAFFLGFFLNIQRGASTIEILALCFGMFPIIQSFKNLILQGAAQDTGNIGALSAGGTIRGVTGAAIGAAGLAAGAVAGISSSDFMKGFNGGPEGGPTGGPDGGGSGSGGSGTSVQNKNASKAAERSGNVGQTANSKQNKPQNNAQNMGGSENKTSEASSSNTGSGASKSNKTGSSGSQTETSSSNKAASNEQSGPSVNETQKEAPKAGPTNTDKNEAPENSYEGAGNENSQDVPYTDYNNEEDFYSEYGEEAAKNNENNEDTSNNKTFSPQNLDTSEMQEELPETDTSASKNPVTQAMNNASRGMGGAEVAEVQASGGGSDSTSKASMSEKMGRAARSATEAIKGGAKKMAKGTAKAVDTFIDSPKNAFNKTIEKTNSAADKVSAGAKGMANKTISGYKNLDKKVTETAQNIGNEAREAARNRGGNKAQNFYAGSKVIAKKGVVDPIIKPTARAAGKAAKGLGRGVQNISNSQGLKRALRGASAASRAVGDAVETGNMSALGNAGNYYQKGMKEPMPFSKKGNNSGKKEFTKEEKVAYAKEQAYRRNQKPLTEKQQREYEEFMRRAESYDKENSPQVDNIPPEEVVEEEVEPKKVETGGNKKQQFKPNNLNNEVIDGGGDYIDEASHDSKDLDAIIDEEDSNV